MGIKRLHPKPTPVESPDDSDTCQEAAASSVPVPVPAEQQPEVASTCQNTVVLSVATPVEHKTEAASAGEDVVVSSPFATVEPKNDIVEACQEAVVAASAPVHWEPGKRLRKKVSSLLPRTGSAYAALDQSPGETSGSVLAGSPEAPVTNSFSASCRSIASPARRRSLSDASFDKVQVPEAMSAVVQGGRSPKAGSACSESSSSSSSSSSASSSSSSGESVPENAVSVVPAAHLQGVPYKEGQRFSSPAYSDAARDFFMTLFEEKGASSYQATAWLVEHGVFPVAKHNQLFKKYLVQKEIRRKAQAEKAMMASPSKTTRKGIIDKKHGSRKLVIMHKRPRTLKKG